MNDEAESMSAADRDEMRLSTAALILAALAPDALRQLHEIANTEGATELQEEAVTATRETRIAFAIQEADALVRAIAPALEVRRFADGTAEDPRARDASKRFCGHGVSMADDCAKCAESAAADINGDAGGGDGAALAAFRDGLQGGRES